MAEHEEHGANREVRSLADAILVEAYALHRANLAVHAVHAAYLGLPSAFPEQYLLLDEALDIQRKATIALCLAVERWTP